MTKNKLRTPTESERMRLEELKADFDKLMARIKPFLKKPSIPSIKSTEGKWMDSTTESGTARSGF